MYLKKRTFYQDRLGTNTGKALQKRRPFSSGKTPIAWQEAMDKYGPSEANPTPPAAGLPPSLVIEQWLSPVWNWANISAITGGGPYASTSDEWPKNQTGGFHALVTDGWYLDSSAGGPVRTEGRKRLFCVPHYILKAEDLSRQARDRHRKS
jgi:hypothetical protein